MAHTFNPKKAFIELSLRAMMLPTPEQLAIMDNKEMQKYLKEIWKMTLNSKNSKTFS